MNITAEDQQFWDDMVDECLDGHLSRWEEDFLNSLREWIKERPLTDKQETRLNGIWQRVRDEITQSPPACLAA